MAGSVARWLLAVIVWLLLPVVAAAQQTAPPPSQVLILDLERFFAESLYGQRVQSEVEAAGRDLASENRTIEAELSAEEIDLTERRDGMAREEFAILAEEFDLRVEAIRAEQEAKLRALNTAVERAQQQFFDLAVPVLLEIVRARNAAAILDRRTVLLAADGVEITDAAIAAVDERLGPGPEGVLIDLTPAATTDAPTAAPAPRPEAVPQSAD